MTLRFIAATTASATLKDAMSRDILAAFDDAGIGIASATYEIVGLPPIRLQREGREDLLHRSGGDVSMIAAGRSREQRRREREAPRPISPSGPDAGTALGSSWATVALRSAVSG